MDAKTRRQTEETLTDIVTGLGVGEWRWFGTNNAKIILSPAEAKELVARLDTRKLNEDSFTDATEELHHNLKLAERYLSRAMDVVYRLEHPAKRGFFFRRALGNAQNIVMTILVRDIKKNR